MGRRLVDAVRRRVRRWWLQVIVLSLAGTADRSTGDLAGIDLDPARQSGLRPVDPDVGRMARRRRSSPGRSTRLSSRSLALLALIGLARRFTRTWFVPASIGAAVLVVGLSFAYPVVIEPAFNEFTPLSDGPLRTDLLELAERERRQGVRRPGRRCVATHDGVQRVRLRLRRQQADRHLRQPARLGDRPRGGTDRRSRARPCEHRRRAGRHRRGCGGGCARRRRAVPRAATRVAAATGRAPDRWAIRRSCRSLLGLVVIVGFSGVADPERPEPPGRGPRRRALARPDRGPGHVHRDPAAAGDHQPLASRAQPDPELLVQQPPADAGSDRDGAGLGAAAR